MTDKKRKVIGEYDPTTDALLEAKTYPAHIIADDIVEDRDTRIGLANIYNLDYVLAKEISEFQQPFYERGSDGNFRMDNDGNKIIVKDENGADIMLSCAFAVGRKLRFHSIFCFTEEKGMSANGKYSDLIEISGIEVKLIEVQFGIKVKQIVELEESDLLGRPVLIRIDYKATPTKDTKELPKEQQEFRYWPQVMEVFAWGSGKPLSSDELEEPLPF